MACSIVTKLAIVAGYCQGAWSLAPVRRQPYMNNDFHVPQQVAHPPQNYNSVNANPNMVNRDFQVPSYSAVYHAGQQQVPQVPQQVAPMPPNPYMNQVQPNYMRPNVQAPLSVQAPMANTRPMAPMAPMTPMASQAGMSVATQTQVETAKIMQQMQDMANMPANAFATGAQIHAAQEKAEVQAGVTAKEREDRLMQQMLDARDQSVIAARGVESLTAAGQAQAETDSAQALAISQMVDMQKAQGSLTNSALAQSQQQMQAAQQAQAQQIAQAAQMQAMVDAQAQQQAEQRAEQQYQMHTAQADRDKTETLHSHMDESWQQADQARQDAERPRAAGSHARPTGRDIAIPNDIDTAVPHGMIVPQQASAEDQIRQSVEQTVAVAKKNAQDKRDKANKKA